MLSLNSDAPLSKNAGPPALHWLQGAWAPLSIVRMLWKHSTLIAGGWILLAAAGAVLVHRLPDVYRAEALILIDSQKIPEKFIAPTIQVALQDHLATINQQILSATQLQRIIEDQKLYLEERKRQTPEEIVARMRKDTSITVDRTWSATRPAAFRVAYEGHNPKVVATVVNQVAGLFISENLKSREQRAEGTADFINSQLTQVRASLEQQEEKLREYKIQKMGQLPEQQTALVSTLARLHSELQGNQDVISRAEQNKVMLENTVRLAESSQVALQRAIELGNSQRSAPSPAAGTAFTPPAPVPVRPSQALRARLESLRLRYRDEHPEVKQLKAELETVEREEQRKDAEAAAGRRTASPADTASRAVERSAPAPSAEVVAELNRQREKIALSGIQLALAEKEIAARQEEHAHILRSIADYQARVEKIPLREQELTALTRDYEISKQNYQTLLDKKNTAGMAEQMEKQQQAERFTLQDRAQPPTKPVRPMRALLYPATSLGTLAFMLALAIAVELRKNAIMGEWELAKGTRVLGRISFIPPLQNRPVVTGPAATRWWPRPALIATVSSVLLLLLVTLAMNSGLIGRSWK
jgi:succinoglycan biosynthesis transport protein ExoP